MAKSRRSYKGAAVSNSISSSGLPVGTSSPPVGLTIPLSEDMSGWSETGVPFFAVIDPGTAKEEKVCVIYASARTLTVVDPAATSSWTASVNGRGVDGTINRSHDNGAVIYPVFTATEADQANELVSKYTVNGDIVVHGSSGPKTISTGGSGNNNKVLVADSTVSDGGVKWATLTADSLAEGAVTSAKILDGTIMNVDINSSAAIAPSKLGAGALPTDVTVASANLVNGTVALEDLATAVVNRLVPVGTISAYAGATAPTGWLLCDGTSTTGYTALAALVGSTTPDFRGHTLVGKGSAPFDGTLLSKFGSTTSVATHSHSNTAVLNSGTVTITDPGHAHTINGEFVQAASFNDNSIYVINADGQGMGSYTEATASATTGISGTVGTGITVTNVNTGTTHGNVQPSALINYIIKHD
jgi:microcystin-dependent protein